MEKGKKGKQKQGGCSIIWVCTMLAGVTLGLVLVLILVSSGTKGYGYDPQESVAQCSFDIPKVVDFLKYQSECTTGIFTGRRSSLFLPFPDGAHVVDAITNKQNTILYLILNKLKLTSPMNLKGVSCLFEGEEKNYLTLAQVFSMDHKTVIWACSIPTALKKEKILYFVRVLYRNHCSSRLPACFHPPSSSSPPTRPKISTTSKNIPPQNTQSLPIVTLPSLSKKTLATNVIPPTQFLNTTERRKNSHFISKEITTQARVFSSPPSPPPSSFPLAACAKVRGPDAMYRIPDWVAYHHLMGVSQFLIFVNEEPSGWEYLLRNYIEQNIVILVKYDYETIEGRHRGHVYINMVMENACLRHYDGVAEWVMISDVDEYFQPMAQSSTILEVVESREKMAAETSKYQVAGFSAWCWFFAGERKKMANYSPKLFEKESALELFNYRQGFPVPRRRQKLIVKPQYVTLFSQHIVERVNSHDAAIFVLHPQLDMRMNHFRRPMRSTGISSVMVEGVPEVLKAWESNYPVNLQKFSKDFSSLQKREYCPDRCETRDKSMKEKYLLQVRRQTEKFQTISSLNHSLHLLPPQEQKE